MQFELYTIGSVIHLSPRVLRKAGKAANSV